MAIVMVVEAQKLLYVHAGQTPYLLSTMQLHMCVCVKRGMFVACSTLLGYE